MKTTKRVIILIFTAILIACPILSVSAENEDIVILYESDVHCSVDGYAKLAAMKSECLSNGNYVLIVSCGDFSKGDDIGNLTEGLAITEIMNWVGYDAVTLGNHEFDYGMDGLKSITDNLNADVVSCNVTDTGTGSTLYEPYVIKDCGGVKIAFIGITTPETAKRNSSKLKTGGKTVCDFSGDNLYNAVQSAIDSANNNGADYIIALSHLGTEDVTEKWSAQAVIQNTHSIDFIVDGHSHSVIDKMTVADANGCDVIVSSVGKKFKYIGKLTIDKNNKDGGLENELIKTADYKNEDEELAKYTDYLEDLAKSGDISADMFLNKSASEYIPLRETLAGLGYGVFWSAATPDNIYVTVGDTLACFTNGSSTVIISGSEYSLDLATYIDESGRTYISSDVLEIFETITGTDTQ